MASSSGKGKRKENPSSENNGFYCNNNGSLSTILSSFPPGFKFDPTDEQLIECYLRVKVDNKEKLPPNLMHAIDLYKPDQGLDPEQLSGLDPEQLSANYEAQGDGEWYFFTPRNKKYPNGNRPDRASGGGYWKASGKDEQIWSNGKHIGCRKSLVFYRGKPPSGKKTNWIMHEFRLYEETNSPQKKVPESTKTKIESTKTKEESTKIKLDDWVLCRIHYNTRGAKQARHQVIPEAYINNTVDHNTMTNNPVQFRGYLTNDPHQSGLLDVPLTLKDVKVANDDAVTIPAHYNVNYPYHDPHQNGESNAYSTQEDVKVTCENTVTTWTQFAGYHPTHHPPQSGLLASGLLNANSKLEDVHIYPNDNTIITPAHQFASQLTHNPFLNTGETVSALLSDGIYGNNQYSNQPWPTPCPNIDNVSNPSYLSMIKLDEFQTNDYEIGNMGLENPFSVNPSEFGGQDDFDLLSMNDIDLFFGDDQLPDSTTELDMAYLI